MNEKRFQGFRDNGFLIGELAVVDALSQSLLKIVGESDVHQDVLSTIGTTADSVRFSLPGYPIGRGLGKSGSAVKLDQTTVSLALTSRPPDLNLPRRDFTVFFLADKINFSGANIRMARKFPHLVHCRSVADCIVDGRFAQRVDADAALAEAVGINAGGAAVLLHQAPGRLAVEVASFKP